MSKKAAYNGPSGTGVDVVVTFDDGSTGSVHVDQGHQLPTEVDGKTIPASVRDNLLEQEGWDVVRIPDTPRKEKE